MAGGRHRSVGGEVVLDRMSSTVPVIYVDDNLVLSGRLDGLLSALAQSGRDFEIDYSASPLYQALVRPVSRGEEDAEPWWRFDAERFKLDATSTGLGMALGHYAVPHGVGWLVGSAAGWAFAKFAWSRRAADS